MAWSRGKKGKLKKMKEKYKDQDEEERQLKMQILQVNSPKLTPSIRDYYMIFLKIQIDLF